MKGLRRGERRGWGLLAFLPSERWVRAWSIFVWGVKLVSYKLRRMACQS